MHGPLGNSQIYLFQTAVHCIRAIGQIIELPFEILWYYKHMPNV